MICHPCKDKNHTKCKGCDCQHRKARKLEDGTITPLDGDSESRLPG